MANEIAASAPAWMDGVTVSGASMRREVYGGLYPAAGIVEGLAAASLPTPDMMVRLPSGLAMVDDGGGGFYPLDLPTQTDLDIAASSVTLPRLDSVIGEVVDLGDSTSIARFRVLTGTPASSPTAPALPPADQPAAQTLRLANVFVQADAEVNGRVRPQDVTVVAPATAAGVNVVDTLAQRDALPQIAGLEVFRRDTGNKELYTGTAWVVTFDSTLRVQKGKVNVAFTSDLVQSVSVTFPVPYAAAPHVLVTLQTPSNFFYNYKISSLSTTAFQLTIRDRNDLTRTDTVTVHWRAERA